MPSAVAISPHLDDAVFSCGGLVGRLTDAGWSVTVVTVFTASVASPAGFALACQLDKGLAADIDYMALRRDEDRAACALLGAATRWLPFREAPHRGYQSAPALFGALRADDDAADRIATALRQTLEELSPDLLLAPQAIGGHVDHIQTVRALRALAARPTSWWRDFPYVARESSPREPFEDRLATLPETAVNVDAARKRRACAAYRTQIGFQFGGEEGLARMLGAAGDTEQFRTEGPVTLP